MRWNGPMREALGLILPHYYGLGVSGLGRTGDNALEGCFCASQSIPEGTTQVVWSI